MDENRAIGRFFGLAALLSFGYQKQVEKVEKKATVAALTAGDIVAIEALGPAIDKAMLDGNWAAAVALFTEDVLVLPPNMPVIKGRTSFLDWIGSQKMKVTEHRLMFHDIAGCGDMAYAPALMLKQSPWKAFPSLSRTWAKFWLSFASNLTAPGSFHGGCGTQIFRSLSDYWKFYELKTYS